LVVKPTTNKKIQHKSLYPASSSIKNMKTPEIKIQMLFNFDQKKMHKIP